MINEIFEFLGGAVEDTCQMFKEFGEATVELAEDLGNEVVDTGDAILGCGKHSDKNILERTGYLLIPDVVKNNSIINHLVYDHVVPVRGSIVRCDLAGGLADHSGIYVGNNRIVELNGDGRIKNVSYKQFIGSSSIKTGIAVYVACDDNAVPLSDYTIADYAESLVGKKRNYDLVDNNCHSFTSECIMQAHASSTLFSQLESVISEEMNCNLDIKWRIWNK